MGEFLDFVKEYGPVMEDVNEFDWLRSENTVKRMKSELIPLNLIDFLD